MRLQPTDLRTGNLVYNPGSDTVIEISWAYLRDMPNLNLQGIQIRDEWFLALGFVAGTNVGLAAWKHPKLNVVIAKRDGYGLVGWQIQPPLEFVHHLQNLFFALKGEDLQIIKPKPLEQ